LMGMKAEEFEVDDPRKAMARFQSVLAKVVKAPKTVFKTKHKHTARRPKRTRKR
jgi:hypothetical protein